MPRQGKKMKARLAARIANFTTLKGDKVNDKNSMDSYSKNWYHKPGSNKK